MTQKGKPEHLRNTKNYVIATVIGLPFVFAILGIFVIFIRLNMIPRGFLPLMVFAIPLTPIFFVWVYVMYRALVPVTGGMPAKGFRQFMSAYALFLGLLLYWIALAIIFDTLAPTLDKEYTEIAFPSFITTITLIGLARNTKSQQLIKRLFKNQ